MIDEKYLSEDDKKYYKKIAEQSKGTDCKNYIREFGFKDFLKTFKNKEEKKEMRAQYLCFAALGKYD